MGRVGSQYMRAFPDISSPGHFFVQSLVPTRRGAKPHKDFMLSLLMELERTGFSLSSDPFPNHPQLYLILNGKCSWSGGTLVNSADPDFSIQWTGGACETTMIFTWNNSFIYGGASGVSLVYGSDPSSLSATTTQSGDTSTAGQSNSIPGASGGTSGMVGLNAEAIDLGTGCMNPYYTVSQYYLGDLYNQYSSNYFNWQPLAPLSWSSQNNNDAAPDGTLKWELSNPLGFSDYYASNKPPYSSPSDFGAAQGLALNQVPFSSHAPISVTLNSSLQEIAALVSGSGGLSYTKKTLLITSRGIKSWRLTVLDIKQGTTSDVALPGHLPLSPGFYIFDPCAATPPIPGYKLVDLSPFNAAFDAYSLWATFL